MIQNLADNETLEEVIYHDDPMKLDRMYKLGNVLKKLHGARASDFGITFGDKKQYRNKMRVKAHEMVKMYNIDKDMKGCIDGVIDTLPDESKATNLIHGDLHGGNVSFTGVNPEVVILDWENLTPGYKEIDIGKFVGYLDVLRMSTKFDKYNNDYDMDELINEFVLTYGSNFDNRLAEIYSIRPYLDKALDLNTPAKLRKDCVQIACSFFNKYKIST